MRNLVLDGTRQTPPCTRSPRITRLHLPQEIRIDAAKAGAGPVSGVWVVLALQGAWAEHLELRFTGMIFQESLLYTRPC